MQGSNIFKQFNISRCCGCGNCINICPKGALSFSTDVEGFIVPKIDISKCINCSACVSVCPYNNLSENNQPLECFAAVNKNEAILMKSSSGGVFFELASFVIKNGGIVYGAILNPKHKVIHVGVDNLEDLFSLLKSKYVQSYLGNVFKEIKHHLEGGRMVLFSGTPCQSSALKSFLKRTYSNLYLVDVVCHGVPNQKLFDDYWECIEKKGTISDYTFRAKKKAQNGMNSFISYKQKTVKIKNWLDDSYYYYFMNSFSGRKSCYGCEFAKESHDSDITLCDYWGWEKYHPKLFDRNASVSGIVINSHKGLDLFQQIKDKFQTTITKYSWISANNHSINKPNKHNSGRSWFFQTYLEKGYSELEKAYRKKTCLKRFVFKQKALIRRIIGKL